MCRTKHLDNKPNTHTHVGPLTWTTIITVASSTHIRTRFLLDSTSMDMYLAASLYRDCGPLSPLGLGLLAAAERSRLAVSNVSAALTTTNRTTADTSMICGRTKVHGALSVKSVKYDVQRRNQRNSP